MTVTEVKARRERGARAGARALDLLSVPLNVCVLEALACEPMSLIDLRRLAGSPPQTTMRGHLQALAKLGVVARRRQNDFPGSLSFELTDAGRSLLAVTEVLRAWLSYSPDGPLSLGSIAAKSAIKALIEGWNTSIIRALAAQPLSLTELDSIIAGVSYPSLERRLTAMRLAGQVEARPSQGRGTPYATTEWLRRAVAPLAAAARWEGRHLPEVATPIGSRDAEAALLLTIPLLRLGPDVSGSCRLAVEMRTRQARRIVGVMVEIEQGRVTSCISRLQGYPEAWAVGPPSAWLTAVLEGDARLLEIGGERRLPMGLLNALSAALFAKSS